LEILLGSGFSKFPSRPHSADRGLANFFNAPREILAASS
jgi:hypothetical protein